MCLFFRRHKHLVRLGNTFVSVAIKLDIVPRHFFTNIICAALAYSKNTHMMLRIMYVLSCILFSFKFYVRFILARGRRFVGQWPVIQWVNTILPQYHRRKAFRS